MERTLCSLLLATGLLIVPSGLALAASFEGLGDLPGGSLRGGTFFSEASAAANGAPVVGTSESDLGNEAFIWDEDSGIRSLVPEPSTILPTHATDVSSDGFFVVGGADTSIGSEAFLWNADSGIQRLGDLPGDVAEAYATGVSADGNAVVGIGQSSSGTEAFLWRPTSGIKGLGDLPGGDFYSEAQAVSGDGTVVAGFSRDHSGGAAFIWDSANGLRELPFTKALDISADGTTIVGYDHTFNRFEAAIWDLENGIRHLEDLPGGEYFHGAPVSRVLAVSSRGTRAVGFRQDSSGPEAFIWDEAEGAHALKERLDAWGVDTAGWQLEKATGISDDGTTIVGNAINPRGANEAFVATVPEPSSLYVCLAALATLLTLTPHRRNNH